MKFRLGHCDISKCWDMSLSQMAKGEKANVTCPDFLDVQRNECPIPQNCSQKNVSYEFEIVDCGPEEPSLVQVPVAIES